MYISLFLAYVPVKLLLLQPTNLEGLFQRNGWCLHFNKCRYKHPHKGNLKGETDMKKSWRKKLCPKAWIDVLSVKTKIKLFQKNQDFIQCDVRLAYSQWPLISSFVFYNFTPTAGELHGAINGSNCLTFYTVWGFLFQVCQPDKFWSTRMSSGQFNYHHCRHGAKTFWCHSSYLLLYCNDCYTTVCF